MVNSINKLLSDNTKEAYSINSNQYRMVCRALTGSIYLWNPDWGDEFGKDCLEWEKHHFELYTNENINEIVYFIVVGIGQPHNNAPKYSLMDFYKFDSNFLKKYSSIYNYFFDKTKIYLVRNLPSNLSIVQNKAKKNNMSFTLFSMQSSPLLSLSWPKITFLSEEPNVHIHVKEFFDHAMSPRYGKYINTKKFFEVYKNEGDWRKCVDTEPLKVLVVNNAEPDVRDFVIPIARFLTYLAKDKFYHVTYTICEYSDEVSEKIRDYDAIILSASPLGDDIVYHHMKYYQWLSNINKPVFGICAGHQIMGVFFGGELRRSLEAEEGYMPVDIIKDDHIFRNEKIPPTRQQHNDSVSCPPEFEILARSTDCENQIMKHSMKPIYSTQFHSEKNNRWLLESFISLAEDYKYGITVPSII